MRTDTLQRIGALPWRASRFTYDARSLRLTTDDTEGFRETHRFQYSGLGHLVQSRMQQTQQLLDVITGETRQSDALGNALTALTGDTVRANGMDERTSQRPQQFRYRAGVGRLDTSVTVGASRYCSYDADGNTRVDLRPSSGASQDDRVSYYAADGRLRAVDARAISGSFGLEPTTVFEEYRYDAFGRRVWVRTDRDCDESGAEVVVCDLSTIRRTVWDGARELVEIQVPLRHAGAAANEPASVQDNDLYQPALPLLNFIDPNPFFGRVLYLPGLALDQPRAVVRFGYVGRVGATLVAHPPTTVSLFWSQQGQVQRAACTAAATPACVATSGAATDSMRFPLTAYVFAFDRPAYVVRSFQGTLLEEKRDGVGTYFRRHRVYDPQTGRFTQEDPIGLAGGINLYGFAGGDPVNFADPFGLCPVCVAWAVFEIGSGAYDAYQTYKAFGRSSEEGAKALQYAAMGALLPGPGQGYKAAGEVAGGLFEKAGIEVTDHFRHRLAQRGARGITEEGALHAYNRGRLFYDPSSKNYIRHDSKSGISVVVDRLSGGKAVTVFEGKPSADWQHVRWRP